MEDRSDSRAIRKAELHFPHAIWQAEMLFSDLIGSIGEFKLSF
jgi:hypothetical protein